MTTLAERAPLLWKMRVQVLSTVMGEMRAMVKRGDLSRELPIEMIRHIYGFLRPGWFFHKPGLQDYFSRIDKSRGIDFSGADFSGLNLSEHLFQECRFNDTEFVRTNCRGTVFYRCTFYYTLIEEANLTRAVVRGCCFDVTFLMKCKIENTDFRFNSFVKSILDMSRAIESCSKQSGFTDSELVKPGEPEPNM